MNEFVAIDKADEDHALALQHVHGLSFWQGWDEAAFHAFLRDDAIVCFIARPVGVPDKIMGFILVRQVADEAEILTFAVAPTNRRQGVGHALLDATLRHIHHQRVQKLFLEVEEKNHAALSLYRRFGFEETGRRPGYYQTQKGRCDALMMRRLLKTPSRIHNLPDHLCNPVAQ